MPPNWRNLLKSGIHIARSQAGIYGAAWTARPGSEITKTMRAYKFLDASFGLKSLYEKRLKISRIEDLNDPFELLPYDLSNPTQRWALLRTRDELAKGRGIVCFSAAWKDPVIWAHYADKHKGICLGFEVPEQHANVVKYESKLLPFPEKPKLKDVESMLFTKYKHWEYEQEIRTWADLDEEENGIFYADFGIDLQLVEVIMGCRCSASRDSLTKALGSLAKEAQIIKARAAHDAFAIVRDEKDPVSI